MSNCEIEIFPVLQPDRTIGTAMIVNGFLWTPQELEDNKNTERLCRCRSCITCKVRDNYRREKTKTDHRGHCEVLDISPRLPTYAFNRIQTAGRPAIRR